MGGGRADTHTKAECQRSWHRASLYVVVVVAAARVVSERDLSQRLTAVEIDGTTSFFVLKRFDNACNGGRP